MEHHHNLYQLHCHIISSFSSFLRSSFCFVICTCQVLRELQRPKYLRSNFTVMTKHPPVALNSYLRS